MQRWGQADSIQTKEVHRSTQHWAWIKGHRGEETVPYNTVNSLINQDLHLRY